MVSTISAILIVFFYAMHGEHMSHLIQYYFIENLSYVEKIFNNWRKLYLAEKTCITLRKHLASRENIY